MSLSSTSSSTSGSGLEPADRGFTLIELAVVILIIGVLVSIALPSFLLVRRNAQHKAAQSGLRVAVSMARVVFADTETYLSDYGTSAGLAAEMNSSDASLDFTASSSAPSTSPFEIMIFATDEEFRATARSKAGVCFYVRDTPLLGLQYFSDPTPSGCLVSAAVPAAWRQTW